MRKLNTGGIAAAAMALVACDAIYRYQDANFSFPALCWAFMAIFGGLAWRSFRKHGVWIGRGERPSS